eukprot:c24601_g1_i3 orf=129-1481(+)
MVIQSLRQDNSAVTAGGGRKRVGPVGCLGLDVCSDEIVDIRLGEKQGDPSVITINCPDALGLGCEISRIIFEFSLSVVRGDLSTDGRWCLLIFWVMPRQILSRPVKWALLKKQLIAACPSYRASLLLPLTPKPAQKNVYILKVFSSDRPGLLNDMTQFLWELEVTIHKMKVSTRPDGKVVDLFYITDFKDTLQNQKRQCEVCNRLKSLLADSSCSCEIFVAGSEWGGLDCVPILKLPPHVTVDLFSESLAELKTKMRNTDSDDTTFQKLSVTADNSLSPAHTLLQISCVDRKGLLFDVMRTLKDFNIQVAYGRLSTTQKGGGEIDLFILQSDGKKIVDPQKHKNICSQVEVEIMHPIRVMVTGRGPDTELLVTTPIEINGCGRPHVLFDITLVLRTLDICIFQADLGRHTVGDQQWELYRFLLSDRPELALTSDRTRSHIVERVRNVLMG